MNEQTNEQNRTILIDPGLLPVFSVANAIHTTYTQSIVRLANTLNLGTFEPVDNFFYRVYLNDGISGENCCIVQKGADEHKPTGLPFEIFITFMTILQIKKYQATYAAGDVDGGATIYVNENDIVSRVQVLFAERPEFELWDILCLEEERNAIEGAQEEDQKKTPVSEAGA